MQRLQVFGHGKAYCYLLKLREHLGDKLFDLKMNHFISEKNQISEYQNFIDLFSKNDKKIISELEGIFNVR